ncbi:hypothetical protein [Mesorhizobium sp. 10J20-29]|jgi:hypothetical protein|nr:hypothetical protein [Alphaproteobacteria bacterium]
MSQQSGASQMLLAFPAKLDYMRRSMAPGVMCIGLRWTTSRLQASRFQVI